MSVERLKEYTRKKLLAYKAGDKEEFKRYTDRLDAEISILTEKFRKEKSMTAFQAYIEVMRLVGEAVSEMS